jgi:RNA polymerase sigma factor (sigma-70 family)
MEVRYKFEQVEKHLYKQAHRIRKKFPNKYELNELVNEVWLKGGIQKVDDIRFVASRAYHDMIDYIRSIEGRHVMRGKNYKEPKKGFIKKSLTNQHDIYTRKAFHNGDHFSHDFFSDQAYERRTDMDAMIDKEQVEYILSCLPKREVEVLRTYYFGEKDLKETGKELGITEGSVCNIRKRALQLTAIAARLFKEYPDILRDQKKNNSFDAGLFSHKAPKEEKLEEVLPEYVADFEIDNEYSTSEEYVLEKDWGE